MKNIFKAVMTLIIFYVLFQYVHIDQVLSIVAQTEKGWIFAALLAQLASTYLAAYRWCIIMQLWVFKESLGFYVSSYFKGSFFNQVLPGSIGGDAVRIIDVARRGYPKKEAFYGVFVDRVVGLVGLLVLNLGSNLLFYGTFPNWLFNLINLITLGGIAGFILLLLMNRLTFLDGIKFLDLIYRLGKRMDSLYGDVKPLALHIGVSVIVHLFSVLSIYFLGLSVGIDLDLKVFLIAIPPIFLLTIVPVSLAGWGVREGAMVGILMLVGAEKAEVLAVSILYGMLLIVASLPGAYYLNRSKKFTPNEIKEAEA